MTDTYRLFVELPNGAKFRAQGDVEAVRDDAERFYDRLLSIPKSPVAIPHNITDNGTLPTNGNGVDQVVAADNMGGLGLPDEDSLGRQMLDRLFAKDRNGTVSLRALPHGEGAETNAMIALIYGATTMGGESAVTGSRLMKAAEQSGLKVERIDRVFTSAIGPFVTTAGFKKGRRYGLTNPGIRRAEDILKAILN